MGKITQIRPSALHHASVAINSSFTFTGNRENSAAQKRIRLSFNRRKERVEINVQDELWHEVIGYSTTTTAA
jgi:hypothetical protein